MNILQAIILGLVQGMTEFLPVSSSAHLVIVQSKLSGFDQQGVVFDVVLHAGTLVSVLYVFRDKLREITIKEIGLYAVAMVPAVVAGFLFRGFFEILFESVRAVGFALFITGTMNLLVDRVVARREKVGRLDAILIGISQAVAIIPGISRSGTTIFTAVNLGIDRRKAAEFSYMLSIPAIVGANVLEIATHGLNNGLPFSIYLVGFFSALISGYLGINMMMRFLVEKRIRFFGLYCFALGIFAILS